VRIHPRDFLLQEALRRAKGWEKVLQHVEKCAKCRERALLLGPAGSVPQSADTPDYGMALERSFQIFESISAALGKERSEAPGLLARLLRLSKGQQQLLIRNSSRYQTWGLFELLIQVGREETFTDPNHAEEFLWLAFDVSTYLDASLYGKERIEDLRARTWGYLGNARRVKTELAAAEEAFEEAFLRLRAGTEDLLERAVLFDLKASLLRVQSRFTESLQLSSRAIASFARMGEGHLVGRSLIGAATTLYLQGKAHRALPFISRALVLIDPTREPRLALAALHNLGDDLLTVGRLMEAQKVLAQARPLYQRFPEPWTEFHRHWVAGKLAAQLGRYSEAGELLMKAQRGLNSSHSPDGELLSRDLESIRSRAGGTP
jgi:tetratricopeptide (TPR) repeat protein